MSVSNYTKSNPLATGFTVFFCSLMLLMAGSVNAQSDQEQFWSHIQAICGKAFGGEMAVFDPESDAGWVGQGMTIHVNNCSEDQIRIPLNVGENRSRTWVFTRTSTGIELKHDHRHEDGSDDELTWYGGHTNDAGSPNRQAFVVDGYSQSLFYSQGLDVSADNIWYVEILPNQTFAYGLTRPNRHFRAEFDLTQTIPTPPPAWGDSAE